MKGSLILALGVATLFVATQHASAALTVTISGTGSGSLDGVSFSSSTFVWTLTCNDQPDIATWGATSPIYTVENSEISLEGQAGTIDVTQSHVMWFSIQQGFFMAAPISGTAQSPGSNILTVYDFSNGWDGSSTWNVPDPTANFGQFSNIATSQGTLNMPSGTVNSMTINTGSAVPEPSAALLGGLSLLGLLRRRRAQ